MSALEHYDDELARLDREMSYYAAICGVDLSDHEAVEECLRHPQDNWPEDKARESLRGLILLRVKIEGEMLDDGQVAKDFNGW
ncbi:hypothetical protein HCX48_08330 [Rhodocyclus tenuis]|uniref:Uncharacterized protein n=1 Tax=Rhodocyclus gracilis TaxID=2929842 RepID=A0ABX0WIT7_9RHOO|nr:hypothetical protein [Rhodocyclus gracilis]MRD72120.1 hypothetical protein [Rhodocyclus gracilis]NJA89225.1 hypothetical protein [Rhodocyclus gracilis]